MNQGLMRPPARQREFSRMSEWQKTREVWRTEIVILILRCCNLWLRIKIAILQTVIAIAQIGK